MFDESLLRNPALFCGTAAVVENVGIFCIKTLDREADFRNIAHVPC